MVLTEADSNTQLSVDYCESDISAICCVLDGRISLAGAVTGVLCHTSIHVRLISPIVALWSAIFLFLLLLRIQRATGLQFPGLPNGCMHEVPSCSPINTNFFMRFPDGTEH